MDQYAGICAALACGFPLRDALTNDALDERRWLRAAPAWAAKLARAKPGAPLRGAFDQKLAEAEAWLGRRIDPIESDVEIWLGFLGAWSSDPEPDALLSKLDLRSADIARVQKRWSAILEKDDALRGRVMKLAAKKPNRLPSLQIVPAKLRPFPWSDRPAESAPPPPEAEPETALPEAPLPEIALVKPSFMRHPQGPSLPAPSVLANAASPPVATPPAPAPPPAPGGSGVFETSLILELPRGPAIPFSAAKPAPTPESAQAPASPAPDKRAPRPPIGETLDAIDLPKLPIVPFKQAVIGETALVIELPKGPALPFAPSPTKAPENKAPERPLTAPSPASTVPPEKGKTAASSIGETVLSIDLPALLKAATPFANAAGPKASEAPKPPPAAQPPPPAVALTLEQHASLSAELALYPGRVAETLQRYRVTPESKRRIDRHYAELGATKPDVHAAWERAYRTYYQWLLSQPRRRG